MKNTIIITFLLLATNTVFSEVHSTTGVPLPTATATAPAARAVTPIAAEPSTAESTPTEAAIPTATEAHTPNTTVPITTFTIPLPTPITTPSPIVAKPIATLNNSIEDPSTLGQFGFGPAFFVISYDDEVLKDSKDVRLRGDGAINASGSKYSTSIGVEVHYSVAMGNKCRYFGKKLNKPCREVDNATTSGHSISPFLGLYDLDNGINGIAVGLVYGYWKGDNQYNNRTSLNIALGKTIHKDQLVLANNVQEGVVPPSTLEAVDYIERKDVKGVVLMISASIGF